MTTPRATKIRIEFVIPETNYWPGRKAFIKEQIEQVRAMAPLLFAGWKYTELKE